MGVSINGGTPSSLYFMDNPIKKWMMTGGYPLFQETSKWIYVAYLWYTIRSHFSHHIPRKFKPKGPEIIGFMFRMNRLIIGVPNFDLYSYGIT